MLVVALFINLQLSKLFQQQTKIIKGNKYEQ